VSPGGADKDAAVRGDENSRINAIETSISLSSSSTSRRASCSPTIGSDADDEFDLVVVEYDDDDDDDDEDDARTGGAVAEAATVAITGCDRIVCRSLRMLSSSVRSRS
jgi:hypothetical protein